MSEAGGGSTGLPDAGADGGGGGAAASSDAGAGVTGGGAAANSDAGDGGTSGVGSGGSAGASSGGAPDFPPACVLDLASSCNAEGACMYEMDDEHGYSQVCYASGAYVVYEYLTSEPTCMPGDQTIAHVYGPEGEACYTRTIMMGAGCESQTITWSDAEGNLVATGNLDYPGISLDVSCASGESSSCQSTCLDEWYRTSGMPGCEPGACSGGP